MTGILAHGIVQSTLVKTISLQGRSVDVNVQGHLSTFNVTFTLGNITATDQMYYRILVLTKSFDLGTKYLFMRVLAAPDKPVLQIQPNQAGYGCLNATITLTCNASITNPAEANMTFFQNNGEIGKQVGVKRADSLYAHATFNKYLNELGTFSFQCQGTNAIGSSPNSDIVNITVKGLPVITSCINKTTEEGKSLSWTCNARGSEALTFSWYKGNTNTVIHLGKTYIKPKALKADAGMYRVTVSIGEGCPFASKTVYLDVQYSPNCSDSSFEIATGHCVSIQIEGSPRPVLKCFPYGNIRTSTNGNTYSMCGTKSGSSSICTISNSYGSCSLLIKVHKQVPEYSYKGSLKITNTVFNNNLRDKNSVGYKTMESHIVDMLKTVYKSHKYMKSAEVIGFQPGSVIVLFQLKLIASLSYPLLPLVEASRRNGGLIDGLQIDPNSIQPGEYIPPPTITSTTSTSSAQPTFTSDDKPTSTVQCAECSHVPAIVLGVLFAISLIFNLLFIGYFVWK